MFCNVGFANDISKIEDIEINGISIGDNLLDHFSKQTLIQDKELLEANTATNKLYYTSVTDLGMFYYESNERVGMTGEVIYQIIGMSIWLSCNKHSRNDKFSKDEVLEELTDCKKGKLSKSLSKYFDSKYDSEKIEVTQNGSLQHIVTFQNNGCYSDNATILYLMTKKDERIFDKKSGKLINSEMYYSPTMNIFLMSIELEYILYTKYC